MYGKCRAGRKNEAIGFEFSRHTGNFCRQIDIGIGPNRSNKIPTGQYNLRPTVVLEILEFWFLQKWKKRLHLLNITEYWNFILIAKTFAAPRKKFQKSYKVYPLLISIKS